MWQVCSLTSSTYLSLEWLCKFISINWNKRIPFPGTGFRFYTGCVSVKYSPLRCWSNPRILSKMLSSRHVQRLLRFCKTSITWIRSLSVILPLFWRHGIAERPLHCREDLRDVLWRHEIHNLFPRYMAYALQNVQFWQRYLTFSILTWLDGPTFLLYLSVCKTNFLRAVFWIFERSYFLLVRVLWFENFLFIVIVYVGVIANIFLLHIFIDLKTVFIS